MKKYKQWLEDELAFLGTMVGTGKVNEDFVLNRINKIEGSLKLINEFEEDVK